MGIAADAIAINGWDLKLQKATLNLNHWIKKIRKSKKSKISKKILWEGGGLIALLKLNKIPIL